MRKPPSDIIAGIKFKSNRCGEFLIIEYFSAKNVLIEFVETKTKVTTSASHIRSGLIGDPYMKDVYGVGFIGRGIYSSTRDKEAYARWRNMMMRCYCNKYQQKNKAYIGCSVDVSWINFQNFAPWFYENYPDDGERYDLDKDIRNKGNRVYSKDNCKFATRKENCGQALQREILMINPEGETVKIVNIKAFCERNAICYNSFMRVCNGVRNKHKGWTRA